jgi:dTDP-4-amino-4,6-dideoxygalactose transaminase
MTRRWYLPLIHNIQHLKRIKTPVSLTNAEELEQRIIGLPFYSDLSDADLNRVVATLA